MTTKNIDLSKLSDETVRRMLTDMLALDDAPEPTVDSSRVASVARNVAESTADSPAPRTTRRRRRTGPVTLYAVQNAITEPDQFTDGVMSIYRAMTGKTGRNRQPMAEAAIVTASGRTDASAKKAAQSAIWFLRNHDAAGNRLNLDVPREAKKAVVVNVKPE